MISNKMHKAIAELAELSITAKTAAGRLNDSLNYSPSIDQQSQNSGSTALAATTPLPDSGDASVIKDLQAQIIKLNNLVDRLQTIIEDEAEAVYTDQQAYEFTQSLAVSLKDMPPVMIGSSYTESYFQQYPRNLRMLIATTLLNHCDQYKITPSALWHTLVANNGALK